jgi:GMP synthase (glutamine-hydrolysing)
MSLRPLCVLVTGETVAPVREQFGEFQQLFERALGDRWRGGFVAIDARSARASSVDFSAFSGVIVTGSPSSVTERAPWMLDAEAALRSLVREERPLLGVCFGHQLLASALGGRVQRNPKGRRLGTHRVRLRVADDPLFRGVDRELLVNVSHEDHVGLPPSHPSIVHLAETDHDEFHAFRAGPRAWGVQFHPEFSDEVTRGYVHARRALLEQSGLDPATILAEIRPTPAGPTLLGNFARIVEEHERDDRANRVD